MSAKYTPQVIHFFILVSEWASPYYCTSNTCVLHFNLCVQSVSLLYDDAEVLQIRWVYMVQMFNTRIDTDGKTIMLYERIGEHDHCCHE